MRTLLIPRNLSNALPTKLNYFLKYWLFAMFFMQISQSAFCQLAVNADQPDAYYEAGQAMNFVLTGGSGTATYEIRYDRGHTPPITQGTVPVSGGIGYIPYVHNEPGMVFCEINLNGQSAICGAAFSPFEIQPYESDPADFDSFWQGMKNQLAAVPINPVLTPLFPDPHAQTDDYRINLGFIDGRRVYGYLTIPAGNGPFPAVITMASHGGLPNLCIPRTQMAIETNSISLSIWMHDAEPDQTPTSPAYWPETYDNPLQNYYRYGPLAIVRAIDYIETMSQFNGQTIGLSGNSEGGGMSLLAAGIDSRVDVVAASLFSMSEHTGLKYGKASGFPYFLNRSTFTWPPTINESIVSGTKYFDALRAAKRFDGPVMSLTNYRDETIMPATNLVAYNQLKGSTVLIHNIVGGHTSIPAFVNGKFDFLRKHLNSGSGNTGYYADAGQNIFNAPGTVSISGKVEYNGIENLNFPIEWEMVSGPGQVSFTNKNARNTTATFTQPGDYILRFRATDQSPLAQNSYYYTITDHIKVSSSGLGDPCSIFGGDNDGDGVCANIDCDDNNPNIGAPGDSCDDGDPTTTDDEIQSDCSCSGLSNGCNVTWSISGATITLQNFVAPVRIFKILDNNFTSVYECNDWTSNPCTVNESFTVSTPGNYWIQIQTSADFFTNICNVFEQVTFTNAPPCQNAGGDADGDGICANVDCDDNDPNISVPGDACDDGDPTTQNDLIQNDCSCLGSPIVIPCINNGGDADGDGVCADVDCNDNDPNISATGDACDDGNPLTSNDIIQADCSCLGTLPCAGSGDADGDGVCANQDCDDNDPLISLPNDACDDGDASTSNDVIQSDCSCAGTPIPCFNNGGDADGDGVCADLDCDDNDANISAAGDACDDGNPLTSNDTIQADCSCLGTLPCVNNGGDADGDGICADQDCDDNDPNLTLPGTPCDDGDPNTFNDEIQSDCSCAGVSDPNVCNVTWTITGQTISLQNFNANIKIFKVLQSDFTTLYSCNDFTTTPCNVNESYTVPAPGDYWIQVQTYTDWANQVCNIFELITVTTTPCTDADGDGYCDDVDCDDNDSTIGAPGDACDDGDPNTLFDILDSNCNCAGVLNPCITNGGDIDNDGVCADIDCDDLDPLIGAPSAPCDDGDPNTLFDILDSNCNCVGVFDACVTNGGDVDNDGVCADVDCNDLDPLISSPGDACDDGNPFTTNDQIQADCSCAGIIIATCLNNVTDGGMIAGDETICPNNDPSPITNAILPTGGTGTMEYLWLQSTTGCPLNLSDSITGANQSAYDPGPISQTTYYRRLSRRAGCLDWFIGESNCVVKTVGNTNCGPPNQCNVSWSLNGNELEVTGLNFPINALQIADINFNHIYVCNDWSNICQGTETISLTPGTYYLTVQTYLDWNTEICHIFAQIDVPVLNIGTSGNEANAVQNDLLTFRNSNSDTNEQVTVYPNPANDLLNVSIPNFDKKKIEIRLVNLLGAPMKIVPNQKTENHFEIDLANISTGIYILWILPEGEKPIGKKLKVLRN